MRHYDPCFDCAYRGNCANGHLYKDEDGRRECDMWEPLPPEERDEDEEDNEEEKDNE